LSVERIKPVLASLDDFTAITAEMLTLMRHFSVLNNLRYIDLLRLFIPSRLRGGKVRTIMQEYCRVPEGADRAELLDTISSRAPKQRECMEYLLKNRRGG
jgi:hypothetical protein